MALVIRKTRARPASPNATRRSCDARTAEPAPLAAPAASRTSPTNTIRVMNNMGNASGRTILWPEVGMVSTVRRLRFWGLIAGGLLLVPGFNPAAGARQDSQDKQVIVTVMNLKTGNPMTGVTAAALG